MLHQQRWLKYLFFRFSLCKTAMDTPSLLKVIKLLSSFNENKCFTVLNYYVLQIRHTKPCCIAQRCENTPTNYNKALTTKPIDVGLG